MFQVLEIAGACCQPGVEGGEHRRTDDLGLETVAETCLDVGIVCAALKPVEMFDDFVGEVGLYTPQVGVDDVNFQFASAQRAISRSASS